MAISEPAAEPVALSVVMPAYNEQDSIADAVADVQRHVFSAVPGAELVVVDDGSKDRTGAMLDSLAGAEPRLRVIHRKNGGHGPALITGMDSARGEYLFLIDSDRQIDLADFPALWQARRGHDAVFGRRRKRHDPWLRLVLTRVVRVSLWLVMGVRLYDANIPCKLLPRALWLAAKPCIPDDTLAPSLFLAIFTKRRGYDLMQMDVTHRERTGGVVSLRKWKLIKFCARGFRQMLAFRRAIRGALRGARQ
jgi:glycosyltransferase involved in cell wall biosynthesis